MQDRVLSYKIINEFINCLDLSLRFVERQFTYSLRNFRHIVEDTVSSDTGFHSAHNTLKRQWNLLPSTITNKPSIL